MIEIDTNIRLRPVRIGLLVRPTDLKSIVEFMRYCTAVWGGMYNPIIPVFRNPPKAWASEEIYRVRGIDVAKGYIRFFEPDVYVEAEKGLLELVGLGAVRDQQTSYPDVLPLGKLLKPEQHRDWSEPAFGLNIGDVHAHVYETDEQFVRRDRRANILVGADKGSGLAEVIFGVFPIEKSVSYLAEGYVKGFRPEKLKANAASWKKLVEEDALTPLRVTGYGLDKDRHLYHDAVLFVFDPKQPTDLIDAWNMRLEPSPVIHVPVGWFEELGNSIVDILKASHRRIQGNPQNLMHNATIEFSRSIGRERVENLIKSLKPGLPPGAVSVKVWRNPIWVDHRDDFYVHRDHRMIVTASARSAKLRIDEKERLSTTFETLSPEFAERYRGHHHRWVNAVTLSVHRGGPVATVLPFNAADPSWPRLGMGGERVLIGSEGWIFIQQFRDLPQRLDLLSHEEAIVGALERHGIKARLSEPGHIAKQMLDHLGGLWGVSLLADMDTMSLLNKMAGGLRKRSAGEEIVEESFELRAAPVKAWTDLIEKRTQARRLPEATLEKFTSKNVIRLGLETDCPHCQARNWTGLKAVDYEISCERCLKIYPFPQAHLRKENRNWFYRVVGPFSVPDYGRGAYAALLALRLIDGFNLVAQHQFTFSTAMSLEFDGRSVEVDFVALRRGERRDLPAVPEIIIGEAKSVGKGPLIKPRDLDQLKTVASKLPGAIIVIAVLRDDFVAAEKRILERFVKWGRRLNADREPTNPVLLLTSNELMFHHFLSATWRELGGAHRRRCCRDRLGCRREPDGPGWRRSQPGTLCCAVQTPCRTPSSYSETPVSGHEPAGVRRSIKAARQPDRLVHREGHRGVAGRTANHARRAAPLFAPGDHHGANDAHGLRSGIAADRGARRFRHRSARPRSRGAGSLDIEPPEQDTGSAATSAARSRSAAFAGGQHRPEARRGRRMAG